MNRLTILFLFHLFYICVCEDCVIDNRSKENTWERSLRKHILCNYHPSKPPKTNATDPITVKVKFIMKSFNLDVENQLFTSHTMMFVSWIDVRFNWDPNEYDGIDETILTNWRIWIPSIELYNGITEIFDKEYLIFPCRIKNDGSVECMALMNFKVKCYTKFSNWPFDAQKCSLVFGPAEDSGNITLDFNTKAISMLGAEYGAEWDIMDYQQEEDQNSKEQLKLTFELHRHATCLVAIILYPSIILSVLTVTCLFLDARSNIRLYLGVFSLLCHLYLLAEMGYDIHKHSADSPIILFYFRGSVIMTVIVIGLTLILNALCEKATSAHTWIVTMNDLVFKSGGKWIVWPRWQTEVILNPEENFTEQWTDFANIVNYVCTFVIAIIYISFYIAFMPQPPAGFYY